MSTGASGADPAIAEGRPRTGLAIAGAVGAVVAGVVLLSWPAPTLLVFSQIAGWAMGVVGILGALDEASRGRLKTLAFAKALGIGVFGVALVLWPDRTILVATVLAGAWLLIDGGGRLLGTMGAESPRNEVIGNVLGVAEMLLGIMVIARPVGGVRAAAVFTGLGLVVRGLAGIWDAVRPRS